MRVSRGMGIMSKAKMPKAKMLSKGGSTNWIAGAIKKPGALRASLGVKGDKPIPAKKLAKAAKAPGKLGQRARLAQTLRGFAEGGRVKKFDEGGESKLQIRGGGGRSKRKGLDVTSVGGMASYDIPLTEDLLISPYLEGFIAKGNYGYPGGTGNIDESGITGGGVNLNYRFKKGGKVNAAGNYTKPGLRKKIVAQVKAAATHGTKAGQWSARKAQLVAKKYKDAGGGYKD